MKKALKIVISLPFVLIGLSSAMFAEILLAFSETCWQIVRRINKKKEVGNESK